MDGEYFFSILLGVSGTMGVSGYAQFGDVNVEGSFSADLPSTFAQGITVDTPSGLYGLTVFSPGLTANSAPITAQDAPIYINNSALYVQDAGQTGVYGMDSTVGSGIAVGLWNKHQGDSSWSTGSIIAGWAGASQIQMFHVDTTGTTYTYNAFVAGGLDYSELVDVNAEAARYEPGDVLVIDPSADRGFALSSESRSRLVAGVYSTKPGVMGSSHPMDAKMRNNEVPLALVGQVPCKVSTENGPISVGDLLVTSSTAGYAMRADDNPKPGTILGKALQPFPSGLGKITVLLTLQ